MSDLKNIKDILSDFEMEYDPNDWLKLEKDLPKPKKPGGWSKTIIISSAVILSVVGIFLLAINNDPNTSEELSSASNPVNIENNIETAQTNINETSGSAKNNAVVNNNSDTRPDNINTTDNVNTQNTNTITGKTSADTDNHSRIKTEKSNNVIVEKNDNPDKEIKNAVQQTPNPEKNKGNVQQNVSDITFSIEMTSNCSPAKVIFTAENVPENHEIFWNTGDNNILTGQKIEYIYSKGGNFLPSASISHNNFVVRSENLKNISINQSPFIKIDFENSKNNYNFIVNSDEDISDFTWSIDGQTFNDKNIEYTFNRSGKHTVYLTTINNYGCKSVASETIDVSVEPVYFVPNAFIPDEGGVNSYFGPIGEDLEFKKYMLIIVDLSGNIVFESNDINEKWNGKINNNGTNAKEGYYLWEIRTIDIFDNSYTKKGRVNLIRN